MSELAEKKFVKLLTEAKRPIESMKNADKNKLSSDLIDSFRTLLELYIKNNEWPKFFEIIDSVEQTLYKQTDKSNISELRLDELLRLVADVFYSVNYKPTAFEYYKKSIRLSDDRNLFAIESLENLIDETIERWHYRMINDSVRNRAYSMAIFKRLDRLRHTAIGRQIRVLDIGTGTGLLSALCLSNSFNFGNGNIKIYACEENEFFYEISRKFLKSIDPESNHVKVINKNSNDLDLKEDLDGAKMDLIVTEIFDDGLLGEGCLYTIYNVLYKQKFLRPEISQLSGLITQSARIFICGVESKRLRKSSRYSNEIGVKVRCLNNSERFEKDFDTSELNFEPYTSENLNYFDDLESRFGELSQPEEIAEFRIGFDDEKLLERLCKLNETIKTKKHLKMTRSGTLDAVILWFELYLDDDIVLTNCPLSVKRPKTAQVCQCWDQAVFNVSKEFNVVEGQLVGVECRLRSDCFMINLAQKNTEANKDNGLEIWLSDFEIRILNNQPYQEFFTNWFDNEIKNRMADLRELTVGYLSNTFSVVFLNLVLRYVPILREKNINLKVEVFVNRDLEFGRYLASIIEENFSSCVRMHFMNELKGKQTFELDYLIYEPLDVKFGVLKKHLISELQLIKSCNSNKDLKIFPRGVKLKGALIESDSLLRDCQLTSNNNLCIDPFADHKIVDLQPFLADYHTPQQYALNINLNVPNYKQLTEIREILDLNLETSNLENIDLDVENFEIKVTQSGRIDFALYWYELYGGDNQSYSPVKDSNLNGYDTFWNQMVAFSLFEKNKDNCLINSNEHRSVDLNFLFKNQMFYIRNLTPIKN